MGSGDNIKLRDSLWFKSRNTKFQENLRFQQGIVKDLIDPATGTWNRQLIYTIYNRSEAKAILSTPHSTFGSIDKVIWPFSKTCKNRVNVLSFINTSCWH